MKDHDSNARVPQELLTPVQVSARLKVRVTTLAIWRCTGRVQLAYVKFGRLVRYEPAVVEAFIEHHRCGHDPR